MPRIQSLNSIMYVRCALPGFASTVSEVDRQDFKVHCMTNRQTYNYNDIGHIAHYVNFQPFTIINRKKILLYSNASINSFESQHSIELSEMTHCRII